MHTWVIISIHAPCEGCDLAWQRDTLCDVCISIHAPREGCDLRSAVPSAVLVRFQSTHPVRGATNNDGTVTVQLLNFNPRTP